MGNQCGCDAKESDLMNFNMYQVEPQTKQRPTIEKQQFSLGLDFQNSPQNISKTPKNLQQFINEEFMNKSNEKRIYLRGQTQSCRKQNNFQSPNLRDSKRVSDILKQMGVGSLPQSRQQKERTSNPKQSKQRSNQGNDDNKKKELVKEEIFEVCVDFEAQDQKGIQNDDKQKEDLGIQCNLNDSFERRFKELQEQYQKSLDLFKNQELESKRKEEMNEQRRREEELKRLSELDAQKRKEEELRRQLELEERRRRDREQELVRQSTKKEEELYKKLKEEEQRRRQREEELQKQSSRKEEEIKKKLLAEEQKRREREDELMRQSTKKEEELRKKLLAEEKKRREKEEELQKLNSKKEAEFRKQLMLEEQRRREKEEEMKKLQNNNGSRKELKSILKNSQDTRSKLNDYSRLTQREQDESTKYSSYQTPIKSSLTERKNKRNEQSLSKKRDSNSRAEIFRRQQKERQERLEREERAKEQRKKLKIEDLSALTPIKKKKSSSKKPQKERSVISQYFDLSQGFSLFDEADPIIFQGELFRFKPGIENNFISRWVQISGRAFRYYRNEIQSFAGLNRPIVSIPKGAIQSIKVLNLNHEAFIKSGYLNKKQKLEKNLFKNLFEIELKECYEDLYMFRDEEIELINDIKLYSQKRPGTPTNEKKSNYFFSAIGGAKSYRTSKTPGRYEDDRLMRRKRGEKSQYEQLVQQNQNDFYGISNRNLDKSRLFFGSSPMKKNKVVQGHLMVIRDLNEGGQKASHVEDQNFLDREFGQVEKLANKNLNGYNKWTTRSGDWYNSERRIIFAARTSKAKMKWLAYFQKEAAKSSQYRNFNAQQQEENIFGKELSPTYENESLLDWKVKNKMNTKKKSTSNKRKHLRLESQQNSQGVGGVSQFDSQSHRGGGLDDSQQPVIVKKHTRSYSIEQINININCHKQQPSDVDNISNNFSQQEMDFKTTSRNIEGVQKILTTDQ